MNSRFRMFWKHFIYLWIFIGFSILFGWSVYYIFTKIQDESNLKLTDAQMWISFSIFLSFEMALISALFYNFLLTLRYMFFKVEEEDVISC